MANDYASAACTNGHFSRFTTDKLRDFLKRLDGKVTIKIGPTSQENRGKLSSLHLDCVQPNCSPFELHSKLEDENYSGLDADSRRRGARLIFRFNRRPSSQAGRRGFDPRLPLFPSNNLGTPIKKS